MHLPFLRRLLDMLVTLPCRRGTSFALVSAIALALTFVASPAQADAEPEKQEPTAPPSTPTAPVGEAAPLPRPDVPAGVEAADPSSNASDSRGRENQTRSTMRAGSFGLFAASYAVPAALGLALASSGGSQPRYPATLTIPFVGPIYYGVRTISYGASYRSPPNSLLGGPALDAMLSVVAVTSGVALVVAGALQIGAGAVFLSTFFGRGRVGRERENAKQRPREGWTISFTPLATPTMLGAGLSGSM